MGSLTVIAILAFLITFSSLFKLAEKLEEENRMLTMSIETSRIYKESLDEKVQDIRKFRHDAVGLLQAIDAYDIDTDEIRDYSVRVRSENSGRTSQLPLLSAIIELKKQQCSEDGILFICDDELPGDIDAVKLPDETDICLIVQNLLDNAYEANLRISEPGDRMMSLQIQAYQTESTDELSIAVTNRIDRAEKLSLLSGKNNPELHGIGLRIVDDIVSKYNGNKSIKEDRATCTVSSNIKLQILHE